MLLCDCVLLCKIRNLYLDELVSLVLLLYYKFKSDIRVSISYTQDALCTRLFVAGVFLRCQ
jgi:hypothetical protein